MIMFVYVNYLVKCVIYQTGIPQFTIDLKQYLDYLGIIATDIVTEPENEHDALEDARWNFKLYSSIKNKYGIQI